MMSPRNDQEGQDTTFAYDVMSRRLSTTRGTKVDAFTYTDWGAIDVISSKN